MDHLKPDQLKKEELASIAPCGIFCGACDPFLGISKGLAKELYRMINGFNILDVAPIVLGVEQEQMKDFLHILKKIMEAPKCPGCHAGGGNPGCPINACVLGKGYLTCAECDTMPCNRMAPDGQTDFGSACFYLETITRRYSGWNIKNLERIREVGYRQFVDEQQKSVQSGFTTSDVISDDMVVTEAIEKMTE